MATQKKAAKSSTAKSKASSGFTAEERAAMKERTHELKTEARRANKADAEAAVLAKIAEMPEPEWWRQGRVSRSRCDVCHRQVSANASTQKHPAGEGCPQTGNAPSNDEGKAMRRLIVSEYVSLDGVMQAPGDDSEYDRGGWSGPFWSDELGSFKNDELFAADALLLGRVTYDTCGPSSTGHSPTEPNLLPAGMSNVRDETEER